MKKKKDENTETTENVKKKSKVPIIAVAALVIVIVSIGFMGNSEPEPDKTTEEVSATMEITKESVTEQVTKEEKTIADTDISPETFVSAVEEAIQGAVNSSDEHITNVDLTDSTLTISVDLSEADTTIVPLEDLAVVRAQSVTDVILDLEQYDDLWNKIVVDFGDVGLVSRTSDDIIENEYGMRCFEIYELGSEAPNHKRVEHSDYEITSLELKHGELLEYTTIAGPLVIKAKIESSLTNKLTINQNYMNVADIILNQGGNNFNEIQYWAVADMADGSESKVIQFTLDKNTIDGVYNGNIVDIELGDYATDLWTLPSLKE